MGKSKKRKHTDVEEDSSQTLNDLNQSMTSKQKVTKLDQNNIVTEDITKKKKKKQSKETIEEKHDLTEGDNECDSLVNSGKKKKKKKRKSSEDNTEIKDTQLVKKRKIELSTDNYSSLNDDDVSQKGKQKKKQKHTDENIDNNECVASIDNVQERKVKKKKKKESDKDEHKTELITKEDEEHDSNVSKKKKKKKKKSKENRELEEHDNITVSEPIEPEFAVTEDSKKSKKKKKNKSKVIDQSPVLNVSNDTDCVHNVSSDKKSKKKDKKKDKEHPAADKEVDEPVKNTPNKDNGEGVAEKEHTEKKEDESVVQGQWKGNLFETEERQNKFLRLLGGMKKTPTEVEVSSDKGLFSSSKTSKGNGLFGSLGKTNKGKGLFGSLGSVSKPVNNVALSIDDAATLNQNLENDFNKALNMKLGGGRGLGLGFTKDPAEGKKFHIDTTKVKSKVFDD